MKILTPPVRDGSARQADGIARQRDSLPWPSLGLAGQWDEIRVKRNLGDQRIRLAIP